MQQLCTTMSDWLFLQYHKHPAVLGREIHSFFRREAFTDLALVCAGGIVKAHQLVLACVSPWLKQVFEDEAPWPGAELVLVLPDVRHEDMATLVQFLYGGEVVVPLRQLGSLQDLTQLLQMDRSMLNFRVEVPGATPAVEPEAEDDDGVQVRLSSVTKEEKVEAKEEPMSMEQESSPLPLEVRLGCSTPPKEMTNGVPDMPPDPYPAHQNGDQSGVVILPVSRRGFRGGGTLKHLLSHQHAPPRPRDAPNPLRVTMLSTGKSGALQLQCSLCKYECGTYEEFKKHEKLHRPAFTCEYCGKGFFIKWNLVAHLRTHTGEKPFLCNFCQQPFRQKAHLIKHISAVHGHKEEKAAAAAASAPTIGPSAYLCSFCGRAFDDKEQVRKHISQEHRDLLKRAY